MTQTTMVSQGVKQIPAREPAADRYARPDGWFRRCGRSGLLLPAISLGCWHNFGDAGTDPRKLPEPDFHANAQQMLFTAFDHGVTHFDLANAYGPAPGSAETRVGRVLAEDLRGYRDELIISTKAGYPMWPGPYGDGGGRKYLIASCEQSLRRLGLDYVDIFYSHRFDPNTPLDETLGALDTLVRQGKALFAGISSYNPDCTAESMRLCERLGLVKPIIHQPNYNMFSRRIEHGLLDVTRREGMGVIVFCPLAQGLLTSKYLDGVPDEARVHQAQTSLDKAKVTNEVVDKVRRLNDIARQRGQTLAQMAVAWVLRDEAVTSALIGASRPEQIVDNCAVAEGAPLGDEELSRIDAILAG